MLKNWYREVYPTDELGDCLNNISFEDLYKYLYRGSDIYKLLGVNDSLVREKVFYEMSVRFNIGLDIIYTMWMNN